MRENGRDGNAINISSPENAESTTTLCLVKTNGATFLLALQLLPVFFTQPPAGAAVQMSWICFHASKLTDLLPPAPLPSTPGVRHGPDLGEVRFLPELSLKTLASLCWRPAVTQQGTHLQQVTKFVGDGSHVRETAVNLGLRLLTPKALAKQFAAVTLQGRDPQASCK